MTKAVRWALYYKSYEMAEANIVEHFIEPTDIVLELGGGIGFIGIIACKRVHDHSQINIYEANPHIINVMRRNFEHNNVLPNFHNYALGEINGQVTFYVHDDFWESSLVPTFIHKDILQVNCRRFSEVLLELKPTFLIIDVEGGEVALFENIEFQEMNSVKKICIEFHPSVVDAAALTKLLEGFLEWGYLIDFKHQKAGVFYLYM